MRNLGKPTTTDRMVSMITKAQALNAIAYLDALSNEAVWYMENNNNINGAIYNQSQRHGSLMVLRQLIEEQFHESDVKVVYEYKLRRSDGLFMDRSNWTKKGKTYKSRSALSSALGQLIGEKIDNHPDKPTYDKFTTVVEENGIITKRYDQEGFNKAYQHWWNVRADKNIRAEYLPQDWTVIAIPVNTNADIQEINVRDWYKGQKP